jgi:hypothetical protein
VKSNIFCYSFLIIIFTDMSDLQFSASHCMNVSSIYSNVIRGDPTPLNTTQCSAFDTCISKTSIWNIMGQLDSKNCSESAWYEGKNLTRLRSEVLLVSKGVCKKYNYKGILTYNPTQNLEMLIPHCRLLCQIC